MSKVKELKSFCRNFPNKAAKMIDELEQEVKRLNSIIASCPECSNDEPDGYLPAEEN